MPGDCRAVRWPMATPSVKRYIMAALPGMVNTLRWLHQEDYDWRCWNMNWRKQDFGVYIVPDARPMSDAA